LVLREIIGLPLSFYGELSCYFFKCIRLTKSDFREPVNIGSDEMVSMNEMAEIVLSFENKQLPIHHIPGPEGVRGRNSDNTLIKEKLGWAPTMKLKVLYQISHIEPLLQVLNLYLPNLITRRTEFNSACRMD